jgi:thioesterase domain-containing protein/acyl carrier protein
LYDSALVKISGEEFIWYLNLHHIIADASSFILVFEVFVQLYGRSLRGDPLEVAGLPSFADYVAYERSYQESARYQKAEQYWQRKLFPGPEALRFYGQKPVKNTTRVRRVSFDLGVERSDRLRNAARQAGIYTISLDLSLYNLFAALFFVQLYLLSGNRRLGVVTPVHNRFTEKFRQTIGLLIELCPLQMSFSPADTFLACVQKVKQETRETMTYYQYGSGISLQNQAFDVMFNLYSLPTLELNGIEVIAERIHPGYGNESLALHITDVESSNSFILHYDFHEDIFNGDRVEQVIQMYVDLVDAFLQDASQPVPSSSYEDVVQEVDLPAQQEPAGSFLEFNGPGQVPPKDLLEFKLLQVWEDVLGVTGIGANDNFFDLGGNSWLAVRLFVEIEKATGTYLPLTTLLKAVTVSDLARVIRQEMGTEIWSNVITIQEGSDHKRPLFFLPGAAENGLAVARIARYLSEDQTIYMFQIPVGSEERQQMVRIEDMAAHYIKAMRKIQPEGPYLLGGYSAGGVIALEVAQQLKEQGQSVGLLAVIDVPAQSPNYKYLQRFTRLLGEILNFGPAEERKFFLTLRDFLFRLDYFLRRGMNEALARPFQRFQRFFRADRTEKQALIQKKMDGKWPGLGQIPNNAAGQKIEGSLEEGDQALQAYDRHMRDHFAIVNEAVKCYIPKVYPGRITFFRSSIGYRRAEMRVADPLMGWGKIAGGGLDQFIIPGNHMQIVREPSVKILGENLRTILERLHETAFEAK